MTWMTISVGHALHRPAMQGDAELHHVFDADEIDAVNAALAAGRPLLVRGEPGIGKSQLARAVAAHLKRAYLPFVVDSRTEASDLMWHFDAVARLAEAQIWGAFGSCGDISRDNLRAELAVENFLHPRPLWWAFDWGGAEIQAARAKMAPPHQVEGADWSNGCVVLIDEIDKAESDVPNGLLEALGAGRFVPPGASLVVAVKDGPPPLVIITSNEERTLPDAFLRRCLVLNKKLPELDGLKPYLVARAQAHFNQLKEVDPALLEVAADLLIADRRRALAEHWLPLPGQAEYLDLLRAVLTLHPDDAAGQMAALKRAARFTLTKNAGAAQ